MGALREKIATKLYGGRVQPDEVGLEVLGGVGVVVRGNDDR